MKIYVGRWELLPENLEGYNGLMEMKRMDVAVELAHELDLYAETHDVEDNLMGVYTEEEFEETFNQTLTNHICSNIYWIRIFNE